MSVVILVLLVIIAAVSAVVAYYAISTVRATIAMVVSVVALVGALGLLLFAVGPRFTEIYSGFGVELPAVTVFAIRSLQDARDLALFIMSNVIGLGCVGVVSFYSQHRQEGARQNVRSVFLFATGTIIILIVLVTAAILLPFPRLLNELS